MIDYIKNAQNIEINIKALWNDLNIYNSTENSDGKPLYILDMFPYPSGSGLHIGHPLGYIATDIYCRYSRMKGFNVLYAMGFDSFGLPAEQYAIETNQHPSVTTNNNINNMIKQLHHLSLGYDWNRIINTSDPNYYKWTQWIFLQMYDSFFDPNEIWEDSFGAQIIGKAKNIQILREKLQNNEWSIANNEIIRLPSITGQNNNVNKLIDYFRLAYLDNIEVNWCPKLGTVLSNEEITKDGKSERGNHDVEKTKLKQWVLRITAYSNRLVEGLNKVDFPKSTKLMQESWIGKSDGAIIKFTTNNDQYISVYTTRADTLLGVTYVAATKEKFQRDFPNSKNLISDGFTGEHCIHPITQDKIPIYIADYVVDEYGTGYVMGVPAHDFRDFKFAIQYGIPMKSVLIPDNKWLDIHYKHQYDKDGKDLKIEYKLNPDHFDEPFTLKGNVQFENSIIYSDDLIQKYIDMKYAIFKQSFKLKDWIFSRQRYWGEPFPIVYDVETNEVYPLHESELPIELPNMVDFKPNLNSDTISTPLSKCSDWIYVIGQIIDGKVITKNFTNTNLKKFRREINTMPNWAGSSWYYLRYIDPNNNSKIFDKNKYEYWCKNKNAACDLYIGGSEHAVLHLLYARFYHMFLFDLGFVSNPEPFKKLIHQGLITADAYVDNDSGAYIDIRDVKIVNKIALQISTNKVLSIEPGKMGKRYKNGLPPEEVCDQYSIDIFRLHMMYMAPITQSRPWQFQTMIGMQRFCQNLCSVIEKAIENYNKSIIEAETMKKDINILIKNVSEEYENLRFNTAIAFMIQFLNKYKDNVSIQNALQFLRLLSPIAPHISEYWYQEIKKIIELSKQSIVKEEWPSIDLLLLENNTYQLQVSIKNKIKLIADLNYNMPDDEILLYLKKSNIDDKPQLILRKDRKIIVIL